MNQLIPHSKPWITKDDISAVSKVLATGMVAQGEKVAEFEDTVSRYLGTGGGVATGNGTSSLLLALHALNISKGDEVILPTYVCRNVLEAVFTVGANPAICDVGPDWVMTEKEIEPMITEKTAAIIAVHIFGLPVNIAEINLFNLPVIEDACQAFGLELDDGYAGTLGDVGIFSFHATKCLTTGEGGMLVSKNQEILSKARYIRDGLEKIGQRIPSPMSDVQATLGMAQLSRYNAFLKRRQELKKKYIQILQQVPDVIPPKSNQDFLFRFPIKNLTKKPFEDIQIQMAGRGINVRRGVDSLIHRELQLQDNKFPNAVLHFNHTFSIPFYPSIKNCESHHVASSLMEVLN
jgi:UDP-4-amino-4-deoxy-L-arabinose-oxoglutarate aminotransferase